jgi:hypothetical protein
MTVKLFMFLLRNGISQPGRAKALRLLQPLGSTQNQSLGFMSEPSKQYAYFTITASFAPEEITRRTGVSPTESWRKGDLHPKRRMERKFNRWSLRSRLTTDYSLENHIRDVLAQLEQNPSEFQKLTQEFSGCMQLVGYFHEGYPGLHFDTALVQGLAKYGLSIDFDFYQLWSDARENIET